MASKIFKELTVKALGLLASAPESFIDTYPEGAVLIISDGDLLSHNEKGAALAELVADGDQETLNDLILKVQNGHGANLDGIVLDDEAQLDVTAVPVKNGDAILLLTHDKTFERNMLSALVDSRARYKDLVDVSSDFAWEIGPEGTFVFVSPGGALDHSSEDFMGKSPEAFGMEPVKRNEVSPFFATVAMSDIDIHMSCADGELAQLKISSLPLFDRDGNWHGSRGVCRDFTEDSLRKAALFEARIREKLLKHLVGIIRDEVEPFKTLTGSIKYIVRASSFEGCKIYTRDEYSNQGQNFIMAASYGDESSMPPDDNVFPLIEKIENTQPVAGDGWSGLLASTGYRHHVNGAICVWRGDASTDWTDDEVALI